MSMYATDPEYQARAIERIKARHAERYTGVCGYKPLDDRAAKLCLHLADILTGPTSGGNALTLAVSAVKHDGSDAAALAAAMKAAALEFTKRKRKTQ